jgi:hypothetical protein
MYYKNGHRVNNVINYFTELGISEWDRKKTKTKNTIPSTKENVSEYFYTIYVVELSTQLNQSTQNFLKTLVAKSGLLQSLG